MNLLTPVRLGVRLTTLPVRLGATMVSTVAGEVAERLVGREKIPPLRPVAPPTQASPAFRPPPEPTPAPVPIAPEPVAEEAPIGDAVVLEELSQVKTVDDDPVLVETEGGGSAGPELHVDEPWDGYREMKAPDIVDRLVVADEAVKAIVRLYEGTHRRRKSILAATG